MNKLAVVVILALVSVSQAQFGRGRLGGQHEAQTQLLDQELENEALSASESDLDAFQARLQTNNAIQERKDIADKTHNQVNTGAQSEFGDRLQKQEGVNFADYENTAHFNNLDADSAVSGRNKFGINLIKDDAFDERASISSSDGSQRQYGTQLQHQSALDAETQAGEQFIDQAEFLDTNQLSAAGESQDLLNAEEASKVASEANIDAQSQRQRASAFNDFFGGFGNAFHGGDNFFGGFGGADIFNGGNHGVGVGKFGTGSFGAGSFGAGSFGGFGNNDVFGNRVFGHSNKKAISGGKLGSGFLSSLGGLTFRRR